jgi:hypothetical protein
LSSKSADAHAQPPFHTSADPTPTPPNTQSISRRPPPSNKRATGAAEDDETVAEGAQAASPLPLLRLFNAVPRAVASLFSGDVGHGVVPLPEPATTKGRRGKARSGADASKQEGPAWRRALLSLAATWADKKGWVVGLLGWASLVVLGGLVLCALVAGAYCLRPMCGGLHPAYRAQQLVVVRAECCVCGSCCVWARAFMRELITHILVGG